MAYPVRTVARHRVVRRLLAEGATSPQAARPLPDLSKIEQRGLSRLLELAVIHEPSPGIYWLDHARFGEYTQHRRRIAILAVIAVLIALFFVVELAGRP
jgi:hypothetical protein